MAFGAFIKRLTGKIKNIGEKVKNKVLPIINKGAEIVQNTVAPAITSIGEQIGGNFGNTLQTIGTTAGNIAGKVGKWTSTGKEKFLQPSYGPA